jgi:hypothetical protein
MVETDAHSRGGREGEIRNGLIYIYDSIDLANKTTLT